MRSKHDQLKSQLSTMQNDMRVKDERIEHLTREIQNLVSYFGKSDMDYKKKRILGRKV